jgi:hypothetical protein
VDVYGSLDELERDFGVRPDNLHRPFIDQLTRPNPDDPTGRSTMRRVTDVMDCWFESGSMSFAQVHYPFENASGSSKALRTLCLLRFRHRPARSDGQSPRPTASGSRRSLSLISSRTPWNVSRPFNRSR